MQKRGRLTLAVTAIAVTAILAGHATAKDLSERTKKNLEAAMHGEAYANLKYKAYAEEAAKTGHAELAKLFEDASNVEANEHFAREASALKLAKGNTENLADAMEGEHYENTKMYKEFAEQAAADGDEKAAKLFEQIAADEGDHYEAYKAALAQLKGEDH